MPTGYTAEVANGKVTDFRTFALRCARQFGATIMQRDDPMEELPKLRVASDYYERSLAESKARLAWLDTLDVEQANDEAAKEYGEAVKQNEKYRAERSLTKTRYEAMLSDVRAWEPPTPEHQELKRFMVQQLTESIDFDCKDYSTKPVRLSGPMWLAREKGKARESIARYTKLYGEELERVEESNRWITALYESLPVPAVPA